MNTQKSDFEKWVDENEPTDWYDKLLEQDKRISELEQQNSNLGSQLEDETSDCESYRECCHEMFESLCKAMGVDTEVYDQDQADVACFTDCVTDVVAKLAAQERLIDIVYESIDDHVDFYEMMGGRNHLDAAKQLENWAKEVQEMRRVSDES